MSLNNAVLSVNTIFRMLVLVTGVICHLAFAKTNTVNNMGKPAPDNFGRLFTSQYERNTVDRARLSGGFIPGKVTGVDENLAVSNYVESAQPIKLLGVLLRADGNNKVWLSGGTEAQKNIINGRSITGNINQSANLKVGVNNGTILKPGQVWSAATGRQEAYQIPVPKPVIAEVAPIQNQSSSAASSNTQTSSVSISEVHSSVPSSTK